MKKSKYILASIGITGGLYMISNLGGQEENINSIEKIVNVMRKKTSSKIINILEAKDLCNKNEDVKIINTETKNGNIIIKFECKKQNTDTTIPGKSTGTPIPI